MAAVIFAKSFYGTDFFRGDDTSITEIDGRIWRPADTTVLWFYDSSPETGTAMYTPFQPGIRSPKSCPWSFRKLNVELMTGTKALQAKCRGHVSFCKNWIMDTLKVTHYSRMRRQSSTGSWL